MATRTSEKPNPPCLQGALNIQNAGALRETLIDRLSAADPVFALDLAGITSCDSAGVQLLCAARKGALLAGAEWRLINPSESVLRACAEVSIQPD